MQNLFFKGILEKKYIFLMEINILKTKTNAWGVEEYKKKEEFFSS